VWKEAIYNKEYSSVNIDQLIKIGEKKYKKCHKLPVAQIHVKLKPKIYAKLAELINAKIPSIICQTYVKNA